MLASRRPFLLAALTLAVALPAAEADAAAPHGRSVCIPVRATGVGEDHGGGMTTATIFSHGVRLGTTSAAFTISGVNGTVASFTGPIVFTAAPGTITAQLVGTLDGGTGAFSSTSTSVTGTGLFSAVTGSVRLRGVEDLTTLRFTETITGRLCVPVGR
jgi:hypothetical protein